MSYLSVSPLRAAILADLERIDLGERPPDARTRWPGLHVLAGSIGLPERSLYRVLAESGAVTERFADAYCVATGRHLWELYPALYEPHADAWVDDCRRCGGVYGDVVAEGHRRLIIRCRECGHRWYLDRDEERRHRPRPSARLLTEAQAAEACELYASGLSSGTVGARYGVDRDVVLRAVRRRGLAVRPSGHDGLSRDGARKGSLRNLVRGWHTRRRIARLQANGLTSREIAQELGMTPQAVWLARQAMETAPVRVRCGCGCSYPLPPVPVLEVEPSLVACPRCAEAAA